MGRAPCCDKANVKKGPWSPEEDAKLKEYIEKHGTGGNWIALPQKAGLKRCGKSCRLRWLNYLRPNIKHGEFTDDEDRIICSLYANIGSRWSIIAAQLPGRTDNDIKNYWNTKLRRKLMGMITSQRKPLQATNFSSFLQVSSLTSSPSTPLSSASVSSSYNSCSRPYYTLVSSFSEPLSFASSPLSSDCFTPSTSLLKPQERFVGPAQQFQAKDNNLIMFGGEVSCSSSDGSCSNQIYRARRESDYEYDGGHARNTKPMGMQGYLYNGVEETQKSIPSNTGGLDGLTEKQNESWGGCPLDYGLEEIKQLISTSSCNNFLFDENKAEERVKYY